MTPLSHSGPLFLTLPTALLTGRLTNASSFAGMRLWNSAANLLGSVVTTVNVSFVSDLSLLRQRSHNPASACSPPPRAKRSIRRPVSHPLGTCRILGAMLDSIDRLAAPKFASYGYPVLRLRNAKVLSLNSPTLS